MELSTEVAIIVLTDRVGRVLMQHRSHDAHPEPDRWTPPGGRLEAGEDAATAAHRELLEETGLTAVLELDRVVDQVGTDGTGVRFHVFTGRTDARQEDVILGEGQAMRFLTAEEIAAKELVSNAHVLFQPAYPHDHRVV
jgi:8-oxo-dGTP diphosphatase